MPDQITTHQIITAPRLAELLSISRQQVYRLVERNLIPHYRIGRSVRFDAAEIREWLHSKRVEVRDV